MSYSYHLLACTYVYMHFCGTICVNAKMCMHFCGIYVCVTVNCYCYCGTVCVNVKMCMHVNLIDLRVECV